MTGPLAEEIRAVLNRHSVENASNTPDFILAEFLIDCLDAFGRAARNRDGWYGMSPAPGGSQLTGETP